MIDKIVNFKMIKNRIKKFWSVDTLKKRLPIITWLPHYKKEYILQDIIAGITVGLTVISQGIAYAVMIGLPPEYGLYASLTSGVVYVIFGSRYNLTVGPTAIISTVIAKYVSSNSADFAVLTAFFSGVLILVMGVFNLGFLFNFISMPVISGFTTAACMQVGVSQLKTALGLSGPSGNSFVEGVYYFFQNITTVKLWEPVLAVFTMVMLVLLKRLGEGCKLTDGPLKKIRLFLSLSRNASVVIVGMIVAYILKVTLDDEPFELLGDTGSGMPTFGPPPFSTTIGNETLTFVDMLYVLGPGSIMVPFIAVLESVAVAKAFSDGVIVDTTQEMIALGLCNIIGSFGQSMPITGSFLRTALNQISGVKTQAGGVTKVLLVIFALKWLTTTFYYIPKASLAAVILLPLDTLMNFNIFLKLWKYSKRELIVISSTMLVALSGGLEYGIITGIIVEGLMALYGLGKPSLEVTVKKSPISDLIIISVSDKLLYCAAENVRKVVLKSSLNSTAIIVIDGSKLMKIDFTVASNLMLMVKDLERKSKDIFFYNFNSNFKDFCSDIDVTYESKFVYGSDVVEVIASISKDV